MSDNEDKNKGTKEDKGEDKDNEENNRIRVVAAIDFGTTFSGFAYAYKTKEDRIFVPNDWPGFTGYYKTPTVLKYNESNDVVSWGYSALAEPPESPNQSDKKKKKKKKEEAEQNGDTKIAERFKLHLCKMEDKDKPYLPDGLDYKTAIIDYLEKIGEVMKDTLKRRCQNIDFFNQVLIVMTVPVEFKNRAISILRECAFKAKIINEKNSSNLKFTTEPEAAAVNCMNILKDLDVGVGDSFMIVDCGGGTVDLTTRKLLEDRKLGEITESKGYYYGGSFVDEEFIKFLESKVGSTAIDQLRKKNYSRLQYMVQEFCRRVKFPFAGQKENFKPFDLDLDELCPDIMQYVEGSKLNEMEEEEWNIELKFENVIKMFDPVVEKILDSISEHLVASNANNNDVSAILLVGGFSESKYLQERVKQRFNRKLQNKISFPERPVIAVVEGAVQYGLRQEVISTRVLKRTYGTDVLRKWELGDSEDRKLPGERIIEFSRLAERGDEIPVNTVIPNVFSPSCILQRKMGLDVYITDEHDAKYCDQPDVKLLGKWSIDIPITLGPRPILFLLIFGELEIGAVALNLETGDDHEITFEFDEEF